MAPNGSGGPGPVEDPVGAAGNAAKAGVDIAADAVNGTIRGLQVAAKMAADGIATAADAAGQFITDLVPFTVDLGVMLA